MSAQKDFAKFIFRRMTAARGVELINSLPILPEQKKIIIDVDVYKKPQKQIAFDESRDVKTISRRYNKALEVSAAPLIAYIAKILECPEK